MGAITRLIEAAPRYAALLKSQYWQPERLESYREQHLAKTLRAAARIPFYAERLGAAPRVEELKRLPVLKRADFQTLGRSVRSLYPAGTRYVHSRSSGTSGVAVEMLFDSSHQRGRNAARARYLRAHGWTPLERTAWFGGAQIVAGSDPHYMADTQLVRRFASVGVKFIANTTPFHEQVAILTKLKPVSLYMYPSDLDGMLRALEEAGQSLPSLRRVMSGGEVVEDSLRERVLRNLGLDLFDNYGSTEAFLAWQCPKGSYHINAEHVLIEIADEAAREVGPGEMGRVLVTTLENYRMPLVRYEIGDYAIATRGKCSCGRTLPLIGQVLGRELNLFRTAQGGLTPTWPLVSMLRAIPELKFFKVVQKSVDRVLVRYVAGQPLTPEREAVVQTKFREYLKNQVAVGFEQVSGIARAPSGKFMLTLSEVPRQLCESPNPQ